MTDNEFTRGSEWRKWDLHIHTPASFHWEGERFNQDPKSPDNFKLIDEMIDAINKADAAVFCIMDYWTFDGWIALQHRLSQSGAPKLTKTIFPGIELRLMAPMKSRLNAHVIFSDKVIEQDLIDFKANLKIEFPGDGPRNLSNSALIDYARSVPQDKVSHHGLDKEKIIEDEVYALVAGSKMAELSCESYKKAIAEFKDGKAIGFMPFDTSDGLTSINRNSHYAYVLSLFKSSPIFETRKNELWEAFAGIKTKRNENWFDSFQDALKWTPRLAVSGSDAHRFIKKKENNDSRGYGDFPSGKSTWIKADPTFEGLLQAIKEPAKRSFIGDMPDKIKNVSERRNDFIDRIEISKDKHASVEELWLDGTSINLNPDLIAVIGNKGSGKSALADVAALLGNSQQSHHFSFLKKNRFRGRAGAPALHFNAKASWCDGKTIEKNLNDNPAPENVELVKYIPQGHFEELCNAHVSGKSDAFENELRDVIFSHVDSDVRLGALDFTQLVEQQESPLLKKIEALRAQLREINRKISLSEEQMQPGVAKSIEERIVEKSRIVEEIEKNKPIEVVEPSVVPSSDQENALKEIDEIINKVEELKENTDQYKNEITNLSYRRKSIKNIKDGIQEVKISAKNFHEDCAGYAEVLGVDTREILNLKIEENVIEEIDRKDLDEEVKIREKVEANKEKEKELLEKLSTLREKLAGPQKAYQKYKEDFSSWNERKKSIIGSSDMPDTLEGLKNRKKQLENVPKERRVLIDKRNSLTSDIYNLLIEQKNNREELFNPVQDLIQNNQLIREQYKLKFKAELVGNRYEISEVLFSMIKQTSGEFRGEGEAVINKLAEKYSFSDKDETEKFIFELMEKLDGSAASEVGVSSLLRKGRSSSDVYDYIYGLEYLKPRYSLMFQGAEISQLSPGQRGALLLIFYLLVDRGNNPIILDQPEENLDNETIVSLLVPVLNEAKKTRQIIMVTHNPNLAVVCDAEQIIHCDFDRSNNNKITYSPGSIENPAVNRKVVDVLEGTMPAFDNRKIKYQ